MEFAHRLHLNEAPGKPKELHEHNAVLQHLKAVSTVAAAAWHVSKGNMHRGRVFSEGQPKVNALGPLIRDVSQARCIATVQFRQVLCLGSFI